MSAANKIRTFFMPLDQRRIKIDRGPIRPEREASVRMRLETSENLLFVPTKSKKIQTLKYPDLNVFLIAQTNGTPIYFGEYDNFRYQCTNKKDVISSKWEECKARLQKSFLVCDIEPKHVFNDIYGQKATNINAAYVYETLSSKMTDYYEVQYHAVNYALNPDSPYWTTVAFVAGINKGSHFSIEIICGTKTQMGANFVGFAPLLNGLVLSSIYKKTKIIDFRLYAITLELATSVYQNWGWEISNKPANVLETDVIKTIIKATKKAARKKYADGVPMRFIMDEKNYSDLYLKTWLRLQDCLTGIHYVDSLENPVLDYPSSFKDIMIKN